MRRSPRSFAELAPDLIVEVKSPSDSLSALRSKIDSFLTAGTQIGLLVNPEARSIEVHRAHAEPVTLQDGEILTLPDLLPGWKLNISEIWSPEF